MPAGFSQLACLASRYQDLSGSSASAYLGELSQNSRNVLFDKILTFQLSCFDRSTVGCLKSATKIRVYPVKTDPLHIFL